MEPIVFELQDGYKDPKTGEIHKRVIMRRLTMADQIKIKKDQRLHDLLANSHSLSSDNSINQMLALTDLQEYHLIVFTQTVEKIGNLDQAQIRAQSILEKLSTRDISLMIAKHSGSGNRLISVESVMSAIEEIVTSSEIKQNLRNAIEEKLGEARNQDEA